MRRLAIQWGRDGWMSASSNIQRLVFGEYPWTQPVWADVGPSIGAGFVGVYERIHHDKIVDEVPPICASWEVALWYAGNMRPIGRYASIEAYEEADSHTRVLFRDGCRPAAPYREAEPIGSIFEEFCQTVIEEIRNATEPQTPAEDGAGEGQTLTVYGDYVAGDKSTGVDQRGQQVHGPQINVGGNVSGPMASGQFESAATVGGGEAVDQRGVAEDKVAYQAHVQDIGWMDWMSDGEVAGTTGQSRHMEAIRIQLGHNVPPKMSVTYQVYVQGIEWMDWMPDGEAAGTTGRSRRMEAIRIRLTNAPPGYSIVYRTHVEGIGWMNWVSDGKVAGTTGEERRLEAICIRLQTTDALPMNELTLTEEEPREFELASLRRQLAEEEKNRLLIEEKLSEFVLETEEPPTLIKEYRQKQEVIERLKRQIKELEQSTSDELE
jgi:hypothetical protein